MRAALVCSLLVACAGPSQQQLSETPTATTHRSPAMPPPASVDDKDRYQQYQQFEDQRDSASARREAEHQEATPPPSAGSAAPATAKPAKRGVAEQAPDQVKPSSR